jgi:hypothetical protein
MKQLNLLLKEDGRLAKVPWRRLTVKVQNYVRAQLAAKRKSTARTS